MRDADEQASDAKRADEGVYGSEVARGGEVRGDVVGGVAVAEDEDALSVGT